MELWEILVPDGWTGDPPHTLAKHHEWDSRVRRIAGGLTILKSAKGQWVCPDSGVTYQERVIPVRIACTRDQIEQIAHLTADHYDQKAVMFYRVSDQVFIRHYPRKDQDLDPARDDHRIPTQ